MTPAEMYAPVSADQQLMHSSEHKSCQITCTEKGVAQIDQITALVR